MMDDKTKMKFRAMYDGEIPEYITKAYERFQARYARVSRYPVGDDLLSLIAVTADLAESLRDAIPPVTTTAVAAAPPPREPKRRPGRPRKNPEPEPVEA